MKNVGSLKKNNSNSPKTPGGISKSLLTPCRRVGLSRNWKKSGPSPFISPLACTTEVSQDTPEARKTKEKEIDKTCERLGSPSVSAVTDIIVDTTPTRNVSLHRKKKSKTLLAAISSKESNPECNNENVSKENNENLVKNSDDFIENVKSSTAKEVSTPVRIKSKSKIKKSLSPAQASQDLNITNTCVAKEHTNVNEDEKFGDINKTNDRSPNDLKKECIVVIQRKIFKDQSNKDKKIINDPAKATQGNSSSQTLFDSDSDDMPLCQLNKISSQKSNESTAKVSQNALEVIAINQDDDFVEHKSKIRKLDTKNTDKPKNDTKKTKKKNESTKIVKQIPNSFDDDEDFDFDHKRTILIRKTYEKVNKPTKAKSTGSITQKDIDELKARIEVKKKMLLAKTISEDTKELRDLIKKWQKGCQDALMELMNLMKLKFPEKSNMEYSEILETLRIPAPLVGYDSENDCFNTPDDESIILSHVNNS